MDAWLLGIARNAALDELRRRKRRATLEGDPEDTRSPAPEDHAELAMRRETVRAALASLDGQERDLIALKFAGGLSNGEMARVLGMSESNVGTRLHRTITSQRLLQPAAAVGMTAGAVLVIAVAAGGLSGPSGDEGAGGGGAAAVEAGGGGAAEAGGGGAVEARSGAGAKDALPAMSSCCLRRAAASRRVAAAARSSARLRSSSRPQSTRWRAWRTR